MSATVISEAVMSSSSTIESITSVLRRTDLTMTSSDSQIEIESAICECCGLTEDCTPAYISLIRERYVGKWICGLCAEAVKDEIVRSKRLICTEEALALQLNVCLKFRTSWPPEIDPTVHLISAVRQILRRSVRSTPSSPARGSVLARSDSCFPSISS